MLLSWCMLVESSWLDLRPKGALIYRPRTISLRQPIDYHVVNNDAIDSLEGSIPCASPFRAGV